jgi:short-subunit dehydrogenase
MARIDLTGRPIAITGASSGIGAATALACAAAGMPVALGARRADRCEALARKIRDQGGKAIAVNMDVTDPAGCQRLIEETVGAFGSIYSIYANAGYGLETPVSETTDADMRAIFECNFFGTLNTIRPALPHFKRAGAGHVLICSSCLAKMTLPFYSAYSATKAAQAHIGRAMNLELEPLGIHTSVICPISTATEFFENVKTECGEPRKVTHVPDRFRHTADRVARATIKCLRRPRAEVWPSGAVRLGMAICNAFPGIEHPWIRSMVRKRHVPAVPASGAATAR